MMRHAFFRPIDSVDEGHGVEVKNPGYFEPGECEARDIFQPQERAFLRVLRSRPTWTPRELADEFSKTREPDDPVDENLVHQYIWRLRRKGIVIEQCAVYRIAPRR